MKREFSYPAVLSPDDDPARTKDTFSVYFPDLGGCITEGDSFFDAKENAAEALICHLGGMLKDGETPPAPSTESDALDKYIKFCQLIEEVAGAATVVTITVLV